MRQDLSSRRAARVSALALPACGHFDVDEPTDSKKQAGVYDAPNTVEGNPDP